MESIQLQQQGQNVPTFGWDCFESTATHTVKNGQGPDYLKGQLNNVTGNPQRTITYTPPEFSAKIPELKAKICSVDTQGTD